MYNTSEFELFWEERSPITLAPELHLTEYVLLNMWTNKTTINADLSDLRHGAFGKTPIDFYNEALTLNLSFTSLPFRVS